VDAPHPLSCPAHTMRDHAALVALAVAPLCWLWLASVGRL
jgi:hypothetical protein